MISVGLLQHCSACDEPAITKKNAKMCLNALIGVDGAAC